MYYVGTKGSIRIGKEHRAPGAAVPEAADWPNLKSLLRRGRIYCDHKDGETPLAMMPKGKGSIMSDAQVLKDLAEAGVNIPVGVPKSEVYLAHRVKCGGKELPDDAPDWIATGSKRIKAPSKKKKSKKKATTKKPAPPPFFPVPDEDDTDVRGSSASDILGKDDLDV